MVIIGTKLVFRNLAKNIKIKT